MRSFRTLTLRFGFVAFALGFVSPHLAFSQPQPPAHLDFEHFDSGLRFGAEWTLTSDELFKSYPTGPIPVVTTPYSRKLVRRFQKALDKKYSSRDDQPLFVNMSEHSRWDREAFSFEFQNKFKMTVFSDPGVLEINSSPSSVTTIEENKDRIQSDIFDLGKKLGVEPALFAGAGHMHIETTQVHPDTIRNFLADFYNHTGLAAGALSEDIYNALGSGEMSSRSKKTLRDAFESYDSMNAKHRDLPYLISQIHFAHDIPLHEDLAEYRDSGRSRRARKYFAISYRSYDEIKTIEIRSIRPQTSADAYLKLARLWVARMKVAETKRELGILVPIGQLKSVRGNPQAVIADFDHYLEEAGLKLEDYKEFVLPWWQGPGGEVETYLAAKALKAPKLCSELFLSSKAGSASDPSSIGKKSPTPSKPSAKPKATPPAPKRGLLQRLFNFNDN